MPLLTECFELCLLRLVPLLFFWALLALRLPALLPPSGRRRVPLPAAEPCAPRRACSANANGAVSASALVSASASAPQPVAPSVNPAARSARPRELRISGFLDSEADAVVVANGNITAPAAEQNDAESGAKANGHVAEPIAEQQVSASASANASCESESASPSASAATSGSRTEDREEQPLPSRLSPLTRAKLFALLPFVVAALVELVAPFVRGGSCGRTERTRLQLAIVALVVPALEALTAVSCFCCVRSANKISLIR